MAASLSLSKISHCFGAHTVLAGVSLSVVPDSRIGIVGPNGTGKTTLLRIAAGILAPDAGSVALAPATATVGYLPQEIEPRGDETLMAYLARRTGVAAAESAMEAATAAMATLPDQPGVIDDYSSALERFLSLGGGDIATRAATTCADLGLPSGLTNVPVAALSGGQQARAALAAILLSRFDVFLLDEPTNSLDFAGLDRLEQFLSALAGGVVVVSHDRAFLEHTVERVVELDEQAHTAREYGGGFSEYLRMRATARAAQGQAHDEYVAERDRLKASMQSVQQWSERGVQRALKTPKDSHRGTKFRNRSMSENLVSRRDRLERQIERLEVVDKPFEMWELRMSFRGAGRSGDVVARLDGAVVRRGEFVLGPLDIELRYRDRVLVSGPNGSGKTTLTRALLGTVALDGGHRRYGTGVVAGEIGQARDRFLGSGTLLDSFVAGCDLLPVDARTLLAKFGLDAGDIARAAAELSPGERTRAELALLMARGINLLVLDEPTNHLDLPAIEQLEQALARFDGTLLLVTHDRRLRDAVEVTAEIELGDGQIVAARSPGHGD